MLIDSLKERYPFKEDTDEVHFKSKNGTPFNVFIMGDESPWDFLVVEYEDTWEDGDAFYPADYNSFEDLLEAMIKEIES